MIVEALNKVRAHYLQRFVSSLAEYRALHEPSAPEILLELKREHALPFKLYRVDMGSNAGGEFKAQEVNPATHLSFKPIQEELDGLSITLSPIAWNGVEFHASVKHLNQKPIEAWALKWLDIDDHNKQDSEGLQAVIHSITEPCFENDKLYVSIDFGSAPVAAFTEFISVLREMGATSVQVSSSCI